MKKIVTLLVLLAAGTLFSFGQQFTGENFTTDIRAKVSFDEIVAYDKAYPADSTPNKKVPENPEEPEIDIEVDESKIIYTEPEGFGGNTSMQLMEDSPVPDTTFNGLSDNGQSIPPDVNGAIGPNHLMISLNTQVRIQDRVGNNLHTVSLSAFFYGLPGASGSFDPKIFFEPHSERWFLIAPSSSDVATSAVMIAVSATDDPLGEWNMYQIDSDPANTSWFDFPSVGYNKRWLVISGNMFGGNFYTAVFALDKMAMVNGAEEVSYSRISTYQAFTLVPADVYDDVDDHIYLLSSATGNQGGSGFLSKFILSGELGAETLTLEGYIESPEPWEGSSGAPHGDFNPQLGSPEKINNIGHRLLKVIQRNNKLWAIHNIFLPLNVPDRSAVQWWQIDTDGEVLQRGRIQDLSNEMFYGYPSLAVNAFDDVMVGFSSFSENQYASCSYSMRYADDEPNTMRTPFQYKDGLAPYYKTYGGSRNRWGDYSATFVDPNNELDFWTLQEYANSPQNTWGTWWAMLEMFAAPEADFSADETLIPIQSDVDFEDESSYKPNTWQWTFEGGTPSASTEENPEGIVYNQAGTYDVQLIVQNDQGTDTINKEDYITVSTSLLPDVDFIANDSIPCMDEIIILSDSSSHDPFAWEWAITPETFQFTNGTNANSQSPEVVFEESGYYSISLTATNINGSNTLTMNDYIAAGGLPIPMNEQFEFESFSLSPWEIDNPDSKTTWIIDDVEGNDPGLKAASIHFLYYIGYGERDRMMSPPINMEGFSEAYMTFQHAYAQRISSTTDTLIVYASDDCGNEWTRLLSIAEDGSGNFATHEPSTVEFIPETEEDWCGSDGMDCNIINLNAYAGKNNVRLMFESFNSYGNALYIDNIEISNTVGQEEEPLTNQSPDDFMVYPNPSQGAIKLVFGNSAQSSQLTIVDMQGKVIHRETIEGPVNKTIDLSDNGNGIYLIRLQNGNNSMMKRVVVK